MKKAILLISAILCWATYTVAQQKVDPERLIYARKNMMKIDHGMEAFKALMKNADKELRRTPETVVEKEIIAASGDIHDYISIGPYWWPDPSKPDGLPYIRKDGERNPEIEKVDRFKLSRFIRSIKLLTYAYYFSGDEKYGNKALDFMRIWFLNEDTRMNPNLNFGQMIPGHNDGKGRGEGLIETYSFVEILDCINILAEGEIVSETDLQEIKQWYSNFLDWMLTSEVGLDEKASKNNHGLSYDVQVVAYSLFTGRNKVALQYIVNFPKDRLFKQIEPDGSQPLELARTLALHYTIFNIEHMIDMCYLAKSVNIDLYSVTSEDGRSIEKAVAFAAQYLGKPQSKFPYQQIHDWDKCQEKLCWTLRRSTFFSPNEPYDKAFKKYNETKGSDLRWLLYAK